MKIDNKSFNEWLEKENITYDDNMEEYRTLNGYFSMGVANTSSTTDDELIGLMVQYLLLMMQVEIIKDDWGCITIYDVGQDEWMGNGNTDLFTALKQAIESIKE